MKPIKFKESNKTFTRPESMTKEECGPLPVYQDNHHIISCWKLTLKERVKILVKGKVWLWVWGTKQQPISLDCENPFKEEVKK